MGWVCWQDRTFSTADSTSASVRALVRLPPAAAAGALVAAGFACYYAAASTSHRASIENAAYVFIVQTRLNVSTCMMSTTLALPARV